MKTLLPLAAAAAFAVALAAPARAVEPVVGATVGVTPAEIAAAMAESGYALTKYERERDRVEARVEKDGRALGFYVDAASGRIAALRDGPASAGARLGAGPDEIAAALRAQGYDVRKIEREHGRIEVKAMRDGRRYELYVDAATGEVVRVKEDD